MNPMSDSSTWVVLINDFSGNAKTQKIKEYLFFGALLNNKSKVLIQENMYL